MADYIYLIQNRLTPAQWLALEAVREAARAQGMPVFLVGGAVRDLTSGTPVRDLDFAVQGDVQQLLVDLEANGAAVAGQNPVFGSVYLIFRGGVRVEVAPTLTVTYPKPGQPEVQPAPILDDLRRRDFTANAMAISLNEGSYGLLLDPLNGTADIENREFRLVSPYGFIEQPAALLRAARLSDRLGWSMEERTQGRYDTGKEENYIQALSDTDRNYELEELFHEEDPLSVIEHMSTEGWVEQLFSALRVSDGDRERLDEVRDLVGQLEAQGLHPDPSAVFFPLVTAKMSDTNRGALKKRFVRQGFVRQIDALEGRAKELAGQLTSKSAALPSDTWRLITQADPEVILYLGYHSRSGAVQAKIRSFLREWPQMRQRIPYAVMQEMRITPDLPGYDKLLDDLFFALIDGKLDTIEATRAFLEPFSPPAPPQVAARRRPAKSTRGRSKRAVQEVEETTEDTEAQVPEDNSSQEDEDERATAPATLTASTTERTSTAEADSKSRAGEATQTMSGVAAKGHEPEQKRTASKASAPVMEERASGKAAKSVGTASKGVAAASTKKAPAKVAVKAPSAAPIQKTAAKKNAAVKSAAKKAPTSAKKGSAVAAKSAATKVGKSAIPAKKSVVKEKGKTIQKALKKAVPAKASESKAPSKMAGKLGSLKSSKPGAAKKAVPTKASKKIAVKKGAKR